MLGENGAGKSTLMNVLDGVRRARRRRRCALDGEPVALRPHADRRSARRHRHGAPALHAGRRADGRREPRARACQPERLAAFDRAAMADRARALVDAVSASSWRPRRAGRRRCRSGSASASRSSRRWPATPRVLILDEPTAVLTPPEVERAVRVLDGLRAAGTRRPVHHPQAARGEGASPTGSPSAPRPSIVDRVRRQDVSEADLARAMVGARSS